MTNELANRIATEALRRIQKGPAQPVINACDWEAEVLCDVADEMYDQPLEETDRVHIAMAFEICRNHPSASTFSEAAHDAFSEATQDDWLKVPHELLPELAKIGILPPEPMFSLERDQHERYRQWYAEAKMAEDQRIER